ncbi:N-acetyl-beta-glucosaminyl-glycoprotein 4-beta-N-acetylgalactosaminyltransferase 1 isoform 1-T1 [Rhynchonycteris naso]
MLFSQGAGRLPPVNLTRQAPPWREEYKGQVNLHVFEDWCGGAVGHLRKNLHFPLFPHTRTTVKKLAVSPKWKNYGLRIFGFLHPARDGDVQFSVASDDNSEFWLSPNESPASAQLVAFVGKTGSEWTAPGEFTKFSSQVSKPRRLMASRRYYFELLHKQDDRGSDHVEVGWRAFLPGLKFEVIGSAHVSLYTDESALKMDHVTHVPQSPASHVGRRLPQEEPRADMLRPDLRDSFFLTPRVEPSSLENVLEPCAYAPTYVVKDFPIARYQGLQFTDNKCFYRESPLYLERFGFYKYMKMDREEEGEEDEQVQRRAFLFLNPDDFLDDEDDRELLDSLEPTEATLTQSSHQLPTPMAPTEARATPTPSTPPSPAQERAPRRSRALSWAARAARPLPLFLGRAPPPRAAAEPKVYVTRVRPGLRAPPRPLAPLSRGGPPWPPFPGVFLRPRPLPRVQLRAPPRPPQSRGHRTGSSQPTRLRLSAQAQAPQGTREGQARLLGLAVPTENLNTSSEMRPVTSFLSLSQVSRPQLPGEEEEEEEEEKEEEEEEEEGDDDGTPGDEAASEDSEEAAGPALGRWREDAIDWQRTFSVGAVDFELLRSDWNDLRCNVSGNLQLPEAEAVDVVAQYMERLNARHGGRYVLLRIVNVEKRRDSARGSRFLLELELQERGGGRLRLSEYVFLRLPGAHAEDAEGDGESPEPAPTGPDGHPELCRPLHLAWRQNVMVHFIVPVKNQARWVAQFLADMAALYTHTGDSHFSVILVDFESEDMDVERALHAARLPRYQYLRRTGNFERSAGLQAGVDAVEDASSIVFLCDLHIHFPLNILDGIRKHCVEGKLAFAPVVMRLGCGSSPGDPHGYWEVNGFGLFGIYKSDFDRVGGMNTEEFRDQWGGEDWELLDRVLQAGLEVERLRLRNFFHYYHSRRGMWGTHSRGQKGSRVKGA